MRDLCLPVGLSAPEMEKLDTLVAVRRQVRRGEALFRRDDPFTAIHAIRAGFFKTCMKAEDGREQIIGFHMAGELLGFDGIDDHLHGCDAIALEDSEVCVIPYASLEDMARESPALQRHVHRVMSREIVRDHGSMLLLGGMRADERVAAFLVNLARRQQALGFSPSSLVLRMSRQEIGTYLGLTLETVSRCLSRLQESGVLGVQQRRIEILKAEALRPTVAAPAA